MIGGSGADRRDALPKVFYVITSSKSSRLLQGQLDAVSEAGYSVVVATNQGDGDGVPFDSTAVPLHVPFERQPSILADVRALVRCFVLMRRHRPAIVNASTPKAGLIGIVAATAARVPHRIYVVRGLRYETTRGIAMFGLRAIERLVCRLATHVVWNSRSLMEVGRSDRLGSPAKSRVLAGGSGNGISVGRFDDRPDRSEARRRLDLPEHGPVIGFVGRLTRDKGIADLLEVHRRICGQGLPATLLVIGDVERGDPIGDEALSILRERDSVRFVGWREDLAAVYPALDLLVFPSYREGLPNVPLEAQLCEVPVVGYAATGTVDAVDTALVPDALVPLGDVETLAAVTKRLLCDEATRRAAGSHARAWVEWNFDQRRIWSELVALYRTCAAPRPQA